MFFNFFLQRKVSFCPENKIRCWSSLISLVFVWLFVRLFFFFSWWISIPFTFVSWQWTPILAELCADNSDVINVRVKCNNCFYFFTDTSRSLADKKFSFAWNGTCHQFTHFTFFVGKSTGVDQDSQVLVTFLLLLLLLSSCCVMVISRDWCADAVTRLFL